MPPRRHWPPSMRWPPCGQRIENIRTENTRRPESTPSCISVLVFSRARLRRASTAATEPTALPAEKCLSSPWPRASVLRQQAPPNLQEFRRKLVSSARSAQMHLQLAQPLLFFLQPVQL